jgi:hypothetical protein
MVGQKVREGRGRKVADTTRPQYRRAANRRFVEEGRPSRGGAMIEIEESAQPLGFANSPVQTTCSLIGERDDIIESLMIAFVLMVGQILMERVAQGSLAEENQLIETIILD